MSMDETRLSLMRLLAQRYDDFKRRLARRLGSEDLAAETLNETYLKLQNGSDLASIRDPQSYLYRIALNVAWQVQRSSKARLLGDEDIDALLHIVDDRLGADQSLADRQEISMLEDALEELPPRRRAIFLAARHDEEPHQSIARRYGISKRMVEKELRSAMEHCCAKLNRQMIQRFGPRPKTTFDKTGDGDGE